VVFEVLPLVKAEGQEELGGAFEALSSVKDLE